MVKNANGYNMAYDLPQQINEVTWKVENVEKGLEKECIERKEMDNHLFAKFDKMNSMMMYQLYATVLTLIVVIADIITKR